MVQFLVKSFPGVLFMETELYFDGGLESVYFSFGMR